MKGVNFMQNNRLIVGIDIGSVNFFACFMDSDGELLTKKSVEFANDYNGASQLVHQSIQLFKEHQLNSISFGMEATSNYNWHLQTFLCTNTELSNYNVAVYCINPRLTKGFKNAYPDLQHNDKVDAFVIADRLRFGRLPVEAQVDYAYQPLRRLTRFRFHLVSNLAREKNYFLNTLFYKFSNYSSSNIFSDVFGSTSLAVISHFESIEDIAATPIEELTQFVLKNGRRHFKSPQAVAQALQQAAINSYKLDKSLSNPINTILASILLNIRTLQQQIHKIDSTIERHLLAFPNEKNILTSLDGIGPVFSSGIIAETGSIKKFFSESSYGKFSGLVWKKSQSGKFEAEESFLTKKGNRYLKYYIIEAANRVRLQDPTFKAFYQKKYDEAVKHHHKRAVVLTARKLLRVIYYLLKNNRLYSVQIHSQPN
jgi:transposase